MTNDSAISRVKGRGLLLGLRLGAVGATLAAAAVMSLPSGALSAHGAAHELGYRGDPAGVKAASSGGNLIDNGGRVLASSNTYAIWWGPSSAWASDVQTGVATFFNGLNGSTLLGIGQQYMRTTPISSSYAGNKSDSSAPPRKVSPSTLGNEVQKLYGTTVDPNGIYFVFTSNFPKGGGFCAWHSYANVGGTSIAVAYMPNTTGVAGCNPGTTSQTSTQSEGLASLVNVTSHEFMEAITDALPGSSTGAWTDSSGSEIGDKCAWNFGPTAVQLANGSYWQLQKEWSNAVSGCVAG